MKICVIRQGVLPNDFVGKLNFIVHLLLSPLAISSIAALFFAGIFWMLAMSKFDISYAYVFFSLNYVFMLALGIFFFGEQVSLQKILGCSLAILAVIIISKS